jgi:hypothetical protein
LPACAGNPRGLVGPVEQLGVNAITLDQSMQVIPTAAALVALNVEHLELADQVAENSGTFSWQVSHCTRQLRASWIAMGPYFPLTRPAERPKEGGVFVAHFVLDIEALM